LPRDNAILNEGNSNAGANNPNRRKVISLSGREHSILKNKKQLTKTNYQTAIHSPSNGIIAIQTRGADKLD
jgi:hypothetical protein